MAASSATAAHHRARIGALSRDRKPDDPELVGARQALAATKIEEFIERTLAGAPELTDEQRTRLAELLKPVRVSAGDGAA